MIVGNTQLGKRTQHAFGRLAAQFCCFNFEVARQYGADSSNRNLQTLAAVRRAAHDIQQAFAADVNFGHPQLVSVRVLAALDDFTDDDAVEAAGNRLNAVNFEAGHRNLIRQGFAVDRRINPFA